MSKIADPDVAEADGLAAVAVGLKEDGTCAVLHGTRESDEFRRAEDLSVVLHYDAVVDHRDAGTVAVCAVGLEVGSLVDDVVYIPLAGLAHGVCQRC